MILESVVLNIRSGECRKFEDAFTEASPIIASMPGYLSHRLLSCLENGQRYMLFVEWETLEDHTIGFRGSSEYQRWKQLLHHFYDPLPTVEHYQPVLQTLRP